jgi:peptidyl-prolyl cis-trans isomerase C
MMLVYVSAVHAAETDDVDEMKQARLMAKPWLMRSLIVGGVNLHLSPASFITLLLFAVQIVYSFGTASQWCEASHILIKDTSPKTYKAMQNMVTDIGKNARKFGDIAEKYSQCPSKTKHGDLGRFAQGDMAPPFDKACFDPDTQTGITIGPIETQFGYHLIFVRKRKL